MIWRGVIRLWLLVSGLVPIMSCAAAPLELATPGPDESDCVILLHGLARTSSSMAKMQRALAEEGYHVVNDSYPSRDYTIEELAPMVIDAALESCGEFPDGREVHFVTHSMGGILLRYYAAHREIGNMGRAVMLAPPNKGSAAADKMGGVPGFDWINGPAGAQLGKGDESVPLQLGPPDFEFAVIAGSRTIDPITSATLPNPDDGKVSVEDTKLPGMADFILVKISHAYIMKDRDVIEYVVNFLQHGKFENLQQSADGAD